MAAETFFISRAGAATNRLAEAEPLMRRALQIDEASFGPDHPDVGIDVNNLAALLQATNRLAEAEPLMRRARDIFAASLGPDHPSSKTVSRNYALLLEAIEAAEAQAPEDPLATSLSHKIAKASLSSDAPAFASEGGGGEGEACSPQGGHLRPQRKRETAPRRGLFSRIFGRR
jgi:hypothetical protein